MARYAYQEMIALDVDTMTVAAGEGQIYAESDVELTTPLAPVDDIGEPITLTANPRTGFLPTFYVDDHPSVRFVSGDLSRILVTTTPLVGPEGPIGPMGVMGPPPALTEGQTVTRAPGEPAKGTVTPVAEGLYKVDLEIPQGEKGERGLPGVNAVPADEAVKAYIEAPDTQTRAALNAASAEVVAAKAPAVSTDADATTLQSVLTSTPARSVVEIRRKWTITSPLVIDKPMTLRTVGEGEIATSGSIDAIRVQSDDVTISAKITGNGATASSAMTAQRAISCEGTLAAYRRNLVVNASRITRFDRTAVELAFVDGFTILGCEMDTIGYAGVLGMSVQNGLILGNRITNLTQPGAYINSYGIALSRNTAVDTTVAPNSRNVVVLGNIIRDVPKWEGIDTHGGQSITITGNQLYNCREGIALVIAENSQGAPTPPRDVTVTGNTVDSGRTDGTYGVGIILGGVGTSSATTDPATGTITGNIVRGYGKDGDAVRGGIKIQYTSGVSVTGNTVANSAMYAISLYVGNDGFTVANNTLTDTWTDIAATCAAIRAQGNNRGVVSGNVAVRGALAKTKVNERGFFVSSSTAGDDVELYGNDFDACPNPVSDAGTTSFKVQATRRVFKTGAAAITAPVLNYSKASETPAEAQLRAALSALGLVTDSTVA